MFNITFEEILERMIGRIPNDMDKREGSIIYDALAPAAVELQLMYIEFDTILKETFGDTASREYLIKRAAERGITPYPATYALLKGVFTPSTINIPIGSRFSLNDLNYYIKDKISNGIYQVECEKLGVKGNQYFGDMVPIEYIDGLKTAQLTELLIPGEDEEDTEDLRIRYFSSFETKPYGGNKKDYIEKTNSIAGVGSTKVTRVWNADISPSSMVPTSSVTTWYQSIIGTLNEEVALWLASVYTAAIEKKLTTGGTVKLTILNSEFTKASSTLIETVQELIDPTILSGEGLGIAPIGHVVKIDTAEEVTVNISSRLTFDDGYSFASLQSQIESVVSEYLLELRKEWADQKNLIVRTAQIDTRILRIEGVIDVTDTKINNHPSNLILTRYQIPVMGGVTG